MNRLWMGARWVAVAGAASLLMSCALFRGEGAGYSAPEPGDIEGGAAAEQSESLEGRLRALVERGIEYANDQASDGAGRLVYQDPYWFKEYERYPEGTGGMEIEIQETASRTSPYTAEVRMPKQRYATRYYRDREDAQADSTYYRDIGAERLSYELRHGRWMKTGSLFMAERTEQQSGGQWVPVEDGFRRAIRQDDEAQGWIRRTWDNFFGD